MTTPLPTLRRTPRSTTGNPTFGRSTSRRGRRARLAVLGTVAAAGLSVLATAGTAHAGFDVSLQTDGNVRTAPHTGSALSATGVHTYLETNSNVRTGPSSGSGFVVNTGSVYNEYSMYVRCYVRGQQVTAGGYSTNVWYKGLVNYNYTGRQWDNVYVWGGNVKVGADPAPGIPLC